MLTDQQFAEYRRRSQDAATGLCSENDMNDLIQELLQDLERAMEDNESLRDDLASTKDNLDQHCGR